jgi:anaerobic selenocysteine-containing dehydrogenase
MSDDKRIEKRTTCPLDCPDSCGMIASVVSGKVAALNGDKEHPYTRGVICKKMRTYHERLYSDKRILYPLQRTGKKGAAEFKKISWEQAYDILARKITQIQEEHGGEAILPFVYAGNMGAVNRFAGYPLFNKLGASQLEETICSAASGSGWKSQCGDIPGSPPETAEDAELIIIWGSNTKVTNMHFWPYAAAARKKGGRVLVIDPYRNITAQSADIYLQAAPGGDSALALGALKALLEKDQVNRDFIENSSVGFEILENYLNKTPWHLFVEQSGLGKERIEEFADLLQKYSKTFIRIGVGMTRNSRAGMGIRSITSLAAALGLFDGKKGRGVLLSSSAFSGDNDTLTWPSLSEKKRRTFNMVQLGNCLSSAESSVKMLFVYNANPLSVTPDSSLVRQALEKEDLFTVVHEQVMTPTAKYADLVLPAATFLENKDIYTAYGHFYMSAAEPAVSPLGETKSNFDFFQGLAAKLGYDDPPFLQTLEERMEEYFKSMKGVPEDISFKDLVLGQAVLSTRCLKGQPFFSKDKSLFSFTCKKDPSIPEIPSLTTVGEFEDADYLARFPFKLITPPHMDLLNSTFGDRYEGDLGEVLIHPEDAQKHSIEDSKIITIVNNRGWTKRVARVTDDTQKGLLVAEGIFWQSDEHPSGINDLTSQKLTDMGCGGTFHESRVSILIAS